MDRNELIITLKNIKGIGNKTAYEICEKIKLENLDLSEIASLIRSNYQKLNVSYDDILNANFKAQNTIHKCIEKNIYLVNYYDELFPLKLKSLQRPPMLLYYKGNISPLNDKPSIAIIGTREPTEYGIKIAQLYAGFFAQNKINIISGLAKGIDGVGHQSALDSNGYTAAFVAQGLNTEIYPKENRELSEEILRKGGALISEYEVDEKANRNAFVERDRLQSGVSDAVLVIETDITGGTMHAVNEMILLNRIIAVLDHPERYKVNNPKSLGNQMLINEKNATPLYSKESLENFSIMIKTCHENFFTVYRSKDDEKLKTEEKPIKKAKPQRKKKVEKDEEQIYEDSLFGKETL